MEKEDLPRLAVGGRAMRRRRLNRDLLARLVGDRYDAEDEHIEGEEEDEAEGRRIMRLLIRSRLLRRRRCVICCSRTCCGNGARQRTPRMRVRVRLPRVTRTPTGSAGRQAAGRATHAASPPRTSLLLAHLLRERGEAGEEDDADDDELPKVVTRTTAW